MKDSASGADYAIRLSQSAEFSRARETIGSVVIQRVLNTVWEAMPTIIAQTEDRWAKAWAEVVKYHRILDNRLGEPLSASAEDLLQADLSTQWHKVLDNIAVIENITKLIQMDASNPYGRHSYDPELCQFAPNSQAQLNMLEHSAMVYPSVGPLYTAAVRNGIASAPRRACDTDGIRQSFQERFQSDTIRRREADFQDSKTPEGQRRIASKEAIKRAIEEGEAIEAKRIQYRNA